MENFWRQRRQTVELDFDVKHDDDDDDDDDK